ncbi:MAG: hypothetical protein CVU84_11520 [Firmicutes bacterium HGW-Firmicutes-1]|jgi:HD-GYP domain-containing protein (c-di-GMP phosphodiesterase class II)|nr:MAG: hypothetical protein CVU84_11520 [Firmicutes bacterium HGW-Firmicutes-1]
MIKFKRIPIDNIVVGMILGDDVMNSNGLILIPRKTALQQKHIYRLKLYDILSVVIELETSIPLTIEEEEVIQPLFEEVVNTPNVSNQQNFNEFRNVYQKNEDEIKSQLYAISNGDQIKIDDLRTISQSLLDGLVTKGELFNYLYHLKANDDYTYTHSLNVSLLCNIFGTWLKLPAAQIEELTLAGLLHDIGKVKVDENILNKPGKLTSEEFGAIKKHSRLGYDAIKDQPISDAIKYGVLMHHEKMDGSGYPLGLHEADIHEFAKIIAIVDIYDAMTSNRSYHKKFSPFKVIQVFEQESYGLLDTAFLFVFLQNIAHNYLGKEVKLSNGDIGKIVFIHNTAPSRPIIEIGERMVDLMTETSLNIEEIM